MMVTKRSFHGDAIGRFRHKVGANEVQDGDANQDNTESENKRLKLEESSQVSPTYTQALEDFFETDAKNILSGGSGECVFWRYRET